MSKRCSRCGREFIGDKALRQHLRVKHPTYYITRHILPIVLLVALVASAIALAAPQYLSNPRTFGTTTTSVDRDQLLTRYLSSHDQLVYHIHPTLRISVDGNEIPVPANIGIEPDGRSRYIHTHDATGVIHVESPIQVDFTFGDFMKIWGKRLDQQCFDIYCGTVTVSVNGNIISDPLSHILRDGDRILVEVTTR
jgi:hypothetical protein